MAAISATAMERDARTHETAATLLGVAMSASPSSSSSSHLSSGVAIAQETTERNATGVQRDEPKSDPQEVSQHAEPQLIPPHAQDDPTISRVPVATSSPEIASLPHSGTPPRNNGNQAFLSMSSIGFGIDSSGLGPSERNDATEAAARALQDAMERSTLRLPMHSHQPSLQIKVTLGVPRNQENRNSHHLEPMSVDRERLLSLLPQSIPVLPIEIQLGGLFLPGGGTEAAGTSVGTPSICTAVACITLESAPDSSLTPMAPLQSTRDTILDKTPQGFQMGQRRVTGALLAPPFASPNVAQATPSTNADSAFLSPQTTSLPSRSELVHRSNSMEMLAMISEEIRLKGGMKRSSQIAATQASGVIPETLLSGFATAAISGSDPTVLPPTPKDVALVNYLAESSESLENDDDSDSMRNGYNYKKLPPGVTTKNNRRLFVKHSYMDHSFEPPSDDRAELQKGRTPNAAFPLKLHETLSQIEENGHGDIIGWLPHGRSFKIHKQKEFAEIILPQYFVMTKKSSFLRQLNLYGFHRFSAGPDQGSYYHERFLRGRKWLCKSMSRQKVNGNRIRSAGNPDEEPLLSRYPACFAADSVAFVPPPSQQQQALGVLATAVATSMDPRSSSSPVDIAPKKSSSLSLSSPGKRRRTARWEGAREDKETVQSIMTV